MTLQKPAKQNSTDARAAFETPSRPYLKVIDGGKGKPKSGPWVTKAVHQIINDPTKNKTTHAKYIEEQTRLKDIFEDVFAEPETLKLSKFSDEENVAYKIINAERPIVFITEKMAHSMGNLSRHLFNTIPNAPIIFENNHAERAFKKAEFCDIHNTQRYSLGHFLDNNEMGKDAPCADVVICFGEPSKNIRDTFPNSDFVIKRQEDNGSALNFASINDMRQKLKSATLSL